MRGFLLVQCLFFCSLWICFVSYHSDNLVVHCFIVFMTERKPHLYFYNTPSTCQWVPAFQVIYVSCVHSRLHYPTKGRVYDMFSFLHLTTVFGPSVIHLNPSSFAVRFEYNKRCSICLWLAECRTHYHIFQTILKVSIMIQRGSDWVANRGQLTDTVFYQNTWFFFKLNVNKGILSSDLSSDT